MLNDELNSAFIIPHSSFALRDLHKARLLASQRKVIAAQTELDRIAQRRPADDFDLRAVAEAHLQQPAAKVGVATDVDDLAAATDAELAQGAGGDV
jgi:hypothetical protein